jgi:dTDP-4-amino-4,6-dideoxygalactose transaminase
MEPIKNIFGDSYVHWTNSGRTCLYVIIRSLDLPPKSRIGVPLYTCPSDFDAIINAGHIPVFLDIDADNLTVSPEYLRTKIGILDAVVIVHTFGIPADMDEILAICGSKPVIEDCAHSLMSSYKGKLTGTIGTAGFFSFRSGKYISAGEGGLIVTKNKELAERIALEIESYGIPTILDEISHSSITFLRSSLYHKPWFGLFALPLGSMIEKKIDVMNKYSFKKSQIRKSNLHIILKKLRGFETQIDINRSHALYLIDGTKSLQLKASHESPNETWNYFLFPVIFDNPFSRDNTSSLLFERGIDNAKMFSKTPEIAKIGYGYSGDCPVTESIAQRILIIPHYYTLKEEELDRIMQVMKNEAYEKTLQEAI